jgi:hypothetical protein
MFRRRRPAAGWRPASTLAFILLLPAVPTTAQPPAPPSLIAVPGAPARAESVETPAPAGPAPSLADAVRKASLLTASPDRVYDRACDGCAWRRPGHALVQATWVNVLYGLGNLVRGEETAKVTPATWWHNMKAGWEWDLNDFVVNQIGHPYQGNNYFTAGRGNGLSFWESSAVAAFGSATWEFFGETNRPSLNDFINTTLGGIALGEMFHRTAWLVRDTTMSGTGRLWREVAATAIDPMTGLNRFMSGDSSRIVEKPADMVPSALGGFVSAGALWRGSNTRAIDSPGEPFLEMNLFYGTFGSGTSRTPYDAFLVRFRAGGGSSVSEAQVRGRLLAEPVRGGRLNVSVLQSYDFNNNDVYEFGAQSFEGNVQTNLALSAHTSVALLGWGGATVLGAVDSLPVPDAQPLPALPEAGGQDAGEEEGERTYDYGPGWNFGGSAYFMHRNRPFAVVMYEARHLFVLDGVRANHLLQRGRLDLMAPLRGKLGIGASSEYFDRRTYFKDERGTTQRFHYPQFRVYLTWRLS